PAHPPPTASAPGPRATALQKLYNDAVAHVLRVCNYGNFASCFPTPAAQVPGAVRNLHEQFTAKLGDVLRREFEGILFDRNVVPSLNELDRVVEEARRRKAAAVAEAAARRDGDDDGGGAVQKPIPPHTLPARQLYISHLAPSLATYQAQMSERQDALGKENAELAERILRQRAEIGRLLGGLESVVRDLSGSVAALQ
ncbi:Nnf1-domain-containing protein, partial [Dissoconium aciculare CBS 342.82]|uniref:Nnf1-domain-containing protein n=1 Tax=Dissoconium aciculare CBS 342.82 TaxID=1314786 RepID=A0A6J3MLQ8_9PEZI